MDCRKSILFILVFISFLMASCSLHNKKKSDSDQPLSFIVLGDNRLPGYLSFTKDQKNEFDDFASKNYSHRDVTQTSYDSDGRLKWFTHCPEGKTESCKHFILKDGWPEIIYDMSQSPNLTLIGAGQEWVYSSIIKDVSMKENSNSLILHTGDIVYNGYYGTDSRHSPYWKYFEDNFLNQLPAGKPYGLPGRFYPAIGNHETWMDSHAEGVRNTVGYLDAMGVSKDNFMYHFQAERNLFIFLDTGDYSQASDWAKTSKPGYSLQMRRLKNLLDTAKSDDRVDNVFVVLHKPPFVGAGHGHLSEEHNPHTTLMAYADSFDITVFSGHVHSTEAYLKNNIKYFVLGGGGAGQVYTTNCKPGDYYCQDELYWKDEPRQLEYNYMTVRLNDNTPEFTMNRWRPSAEPSFEKCSFEIRENNMTYSCQ